MREAGGLVTDFTGNHGYLLSGNLVAGNPRVVKSMLSNMRDELSEFWNNKTHSREQLIANLQAWCLRAEESGIEALREFSLRLRAVRV